MLRSLLSILRKDERIEGTPVDLAEEGRSSSDSYQTVWYGIYLHETHSRIGYIDLRLGHNDELYYAGNIGYHIYPRYRGHSYAYEAARLLLHEAHARFGMDEVIITCSPENIASRKTLDRLGGELLEITDVPAWHWLYQRGETVKRIYRFDLTDR